MSTRAALIFVIMPPEPTVVPASPATASAAALMVATAAAMPMRLFTHRSYSRLWPHLPVAK